MMKTSDDMRKTYVNIMKTYVGIMKTYVLLISICLSGLLIDGNVLSDQPGNLISLFCLDSEKKI